MQKGRIGRGSTSEACGQAAFAQLLFWREACASNSRGPRGPKVYFLHAPEVECIGKGKAHRPYEFGVKVSVATTLKPCKGGQFVTYVVPYSEEGEFVRYVTPAVSTHHELVAAGSTPAQDRTGAADLRRRCKDRRRARHRDAT